MTLEERIEALEKEKEAVKEQTAQIHLTNHSLTVTRGGVCLVRLLKF